MNAKDLLRKALIEMGADGLYNGDGECGCNVFDLEPCGECVLDYCQPAKKKSDGLYYSMEEEP